METALKINEISIIDAEGFSGGELKHGTITPRARDPHISIQQRREPGLYLLQNR
ncbi:hypothetical protein GF326_08520 [Candidatus Bathyarchaeota archaeon]|nr:hypothetical protein [Candidatus Bathyarchaeota archaeon]